MFYLYLWANVFISRLPYQSPLYTDNFFLDQFFSVALFSEKWILQTQIIEVSKYRVLRETFIKEKSTVKMIQEKRVVAIATLSAGKAFGPTNLHKTPKFKHKYKIPSTSISCGSTYDWNCFNP